MSPSKRPAALDPDEMLTTSMIGAEFLPGKPLGWKTWASYVSRGQAPPADGHELLSQKPYWYRRTVTAWFEAGRPGRGARRDVAARRNLTPEQVDAIQRAVACPFCGSPRFRPCRTKAGRLSPAPHGPRIADAARVAERAEEASAAV